MSRFVSFKPSQTPPSFWQQVGIPARGALLHDALHQGLPFSVYTKLLAMSGLERGELAQATVIPKATLQRRAKAGNFSREESDRLYRFAEVFNSALALFEHDEAQASSWLKTPLAALANKRPLDMLTTTAETEAVLNLIGRLEHGVFS